MHASTIDKVLRATEAATTLQELRACVVEVLLIAIQQNAEINDLRDRRPAIAAALTTFDKSHKGRSSRR